MSNYQAFVGSICKPGEEILLSLTPQQCHIIHMTMGVSGEAGELLDAIKKYTMYQKPLDLKNVIEELGDLEFYLEGIRQGLGIGREEVIEKNIEKLSKRYPQGYSNQAAIDRADKN